MSGSSKVRILSDRVANQIAAGEVIERPAAVVKELVENALDAGATRVEVEFRHGGRSLMRVEDNGSGMSRDDALLALERHATSKITEAADLDRLGTLGFRGEAVPSIASVSNFQLQTREPSAAGGTEIVVNGGRLVHVRECGRPAGTRIEVAHLFNSVPARRKFLKSDATEAAHIIHAVRLYALAFPRVAFTLVEDGRAIFRSPRCETLAERVGGIFGKQIADGLVPVEAAENGMRLSGLVGRPGQGRATRHEMLVFINHRPVDSRTLNYALIESFHEALPKGRYPVAFIFFEIDPAAVDVNVHPAKREVRFRSEPAVRSFVIRAILTTLRELGAAAREKSGAGILPAGGAIAQHAADFQPVGSGGTGNSSGMGDPPVGSSGTGDPPVGSGGMGDSPMLPSNEHGSPAHATQPPTAQPPTIQPAAPAPRAPRILPPAPPVGIQKITTNPPDAPSSRASSSGDAIPAPPSPVPVPHSAFPIPHSPSAPAWRYLGLAHSAYALFETPAGLVLLDRRAAHERVWFERLRAQFRSGDVPSQRLLLPVPVELDAIATALLLDRLDFFNGHGFEITVFGRNFFRIESVPAWMEPSDAGPFVRDLLGALREGRLQDKNIDLARDELARLAITKAIRLPVTVSEPEIRATLGQLFACETPLTSPAGRPTFIEIPRSELARRFAK
ncbi:MAG: DNA mismatch repair endonuclease MutL [Opitutaceae bacterium]|nr:DNA mismatch repair endonuclease MutL [Opitutaceae bacterium]